MDCIGFVSDGTGIGTGEYAASIGYWIKHFRFKIVSCLRLIPTAPASARAALCNVSKMINDEK